MNDAGLMQIEKRVIGNAELYLGDCLQVMHVIEHADCTITDPPYEASMHTGDRVVKAASGWGTQAVPHVFEAMDDRTRSAITEEIVKKTSGWALIFCQSEGAHYWIEQLKRYNAKYRFTGIWVKPSSKPNLNGDAPGLGYESIVGAWCTATGKSKWNGGGKAAVWVANPEKRTVNNTHTSIKPIKLMNELVALFSDKGQVILDPFLGSGSTGVAAVNAGRRFIGIERNPEFFEIACRRIEEAQHESLINEPYVKTKSRVTVPLFEEEPKKVVAPKLKAVAQARTPAVPVPVERRFAPPKITVASRAAAVASKPPLKNPFMERHGPVLAKAGKERMPFEDRWTGTSDSPVGVDVETFSNFFLVCFERFEDGKRRSFEFSDRCPLDKAGLKEIVENNLLVSFNGMTYDLPLIYLALKGADNVDLKLASDRIIRTSIRYWEVEKEFGIQIPGIVNHIDMMEPNPSIRQSLKTLHGRLHGKLMMDLPYDPDTRLTPEQMNVATLYCFNDLEATHTLWNAMREPMELRQMLSAKYKMDLRSKSDAQIGEAVIKKGVEEALRRRVKRPENTSSSLVFHYEPPEFIKFKNAQLNSILDTIRLTSFSLNGAGHVVMPKSLTDVNIAMGVSVYHMGIGGLHSTEAHRAVRSDNENVLVDIDVSSHYPEIIVKLGLYPKALGPAFTKVYAKMKNERQAAQAAGNKTEAEGGKIAVNGIFGKLASMYSVLFAPHIMVATTLTGQLSILMIIEQAEAHGISVVSSNTDGVVFLCPRAKEDELKVLIAGWEEVTGFKTKMEHYRAIYSSSVNSYIAIKENGKVKRKGPIANPWAEGDIRGQLMKNPQMTICSDAVVELILHGTPVEQTIRACRDVRDFVTVIKATGGTKWRGEYLAEVVRYYWSTDNDPILYANANRKVAKTDGAKPLMELPDELPDDIDYDRYVAEAEALAEDLAVLQNDFQLSEAS